MRIKKKKLWSATWSRDIFFESGNIIFFSWLHLLRARSEVPIPKLKRALKFFALPFVSRRRLWQIPLKRHKTHYTTILLLKVARLSPHSSGIRENDYTFLHGPYTPKVSKKKSSKQWNSYKNKQYRLLRRIPFLSENAQNGLSAIPSFAFRKFQPAELYHPLNYYPKMVLVAWSNTMRPKSGDVILDA